MTTPRTVESRRDGLWVVEHLPAAPVGGVPVVVLVHGSMDRATSFAKVARRLPDLHVRRYDRRGYGRSRPAGAERSATLADHVEDLLQVVGDDPAVVVGHSIGGVVALAAAQARPDLVRAVGAYEAPMQWLPWWPKQSAGTVALGAAPDVDPAQVAEVFLRRMIGDARWERLPARTRAERLAEGPALVAELRSARAGPAYDLGALTVPVLAAHGSDSAEHHIAASRRLAEATGEGPRVIDGAGHGAHSSHPDQFADLVRAVVALGRRSPAA